MYPKPYGALLLLLVCCLKQHPPPAMMHLNTLTGLDLFYTGLQWQIPSDGSNLRRGIELKHIPQIFKLFLKLTARHKFKSSVYWV